MTREAETQALIRAEASAKGGRLWRNNVGVLLDKRGVPIRFGLCNDSATVNAGLKSGDLIGIMPVLITPEMVGMYIGQFVSREVKRPGWEYHGDAREVAQQRWIDLINGLGGGAGFATEVGTL